jgi:hypothetical protein
MMIDTHFPTPSVLQLLSDLVKRTPSFLSEQKHLHHSFIHSFIYINMNYWILILVYVLEYLTIIYFDKLRFVKGTPASNLASIASFKN